MFKLTKDMLQLLIILNTQLLPYFLPFGCIGDNKNTIAMKNVKLTMQPFK